eukprot:3372557-Amphidinium_carterae.1
MFFGTLGLKAGGTVTNFRSQTAGEQLRRSRCEHPILRKVSCIDSTDSSNSDGSSAQRQQRFNNSINNRDTSPQRSPTSPSPQEV